MRRLIKIMIISGLALSFSFSVEAVSKCSTKGNVKTCRTKTKDFTVTNRFVLKNNKLVSSTQEKYQHSIKKVIFKNTKKYSVVLNMSMNQYFVGNYRENTMYYKNGKRKQYRKLEKNKTYTQVSNDYYNTRGVFTKRVLNEHYNKGHVLKRSITITAHSNGKHAHYQQLDYTRNTITYRLTKKYTSRGYLTFYESVDTRNNLITMSKQFNNKGKTLKTIHLYYNGKKQLIRHVTSTPYSNGKMYSKVDRSYSNSVIIKTITTYYHNNKRNSLISTNNYSYQQGSILKIVSSFYDKYSFKYNGTKQVDYNPKTKKIIAATKTMFYSSNVVASKTDYHYQDGALIKDITNFFTKAKVRYAMSVKQYLNNKLSSNLRTTYSNNKTTYIKGYIYTNKTYQYLHQEYANGLIFLSDSTTYLNNTMQKTFYTRAYYKNGKQVNQENYTYQNGEIAKQSFNNNGVLSSANAVTKSYPISKGVTTSPSWFYPSSFGGGWHPGIDVASYSIAKYGYKQPLKVFNDATIITRNNSCATTGSMACGRGFGNYTVVVTKYNNKYYTILYAHQTKLSTGNANHKQILNKKTLKKNEVFGYVGNSGYSSGYHVHIQVQEHKYAKSIADVQARYKKHNNSLFDVNYNNLSNNNDIVTVNPDVLFNLKYYKSW